MFSKGYKINDRYEIVKTIGEGGMAFLFRLYCSLLHVFIVEHYLLSFWGTL